LIHRGFVKYDELDPTTGETKIVDLIVKELEKYLPITIIDYSTNEQQVQQYKAQEGAMKAKALLKKTNAFTAATERALSTNAEAAAVANQNAQKANPTTPLEAVPTATGFSKRL
jgi:hypothetical protein